MVRRIECVLVRLYRITMVRIVLEIERQAARGGPVDAVTEVVFIDDRHPAIPERHGVATPTGRLVEWTRQ